MKKTSIGVLAVFATAYFIMQSCGPQENKVETVPSFFAGWTLPQDADTTCTVSPSSLKSWFAGGNITENGVVAPANSLMAPHNDNCDFYRWSMQMFLWITSPADQAYGSVLESPDFYTVSTLNASTKTRTLIKHEPGVLLRAQANVQKNDTFNTEEGQATDDVLMDRYGNMVYYISFVNDVYANYLDAVAAKQMSGAKFPTTKAELDTIVDYAKTQGKNVLNTNTLAMELKTSWVDATSLTNTEQFVTIRAMVPKYRKVNDSIMVIDGEKEDTLALIGMHIVGSIDGHPELVWATFEHRYNSPNMNYEYFNLQKQLVKQPADTNNGAWILNSNVSATPNVHHMTMSSDTIFTVMQYGFTPSNTTRTKPFGSGVDVQPNKEDATPAASNTEIISINNSVSNQLIGNDVRKNYVFVGATWTFGGAAPDGTSFNPSNVTEGAAIGASQLANSTMETYAQNGITFNKFGSCFSCHSGNTPSVRPGDLSHIYTALLNGKSQ